MYDVDINETGSDDTQILITFQHFLNNMKHGQSKTDTLMDRCIVDGWIYSGYLHDHGRITDNTLCIVRTMYDAISSNLDVVLYTDPHEVDIHHDGVRSTDVSFRDDIILRYDNWLDETQLNVVHLKGDVDERFNIITAQLNL